MASRKRAMILGFVAGAVVLVFLGGAVVLTVTGTFILAAFVGGGAYLLARRFM